MSTRANRTASLPANIRMTRASSTPNNHHPNIKTEADIRLLFETSPQPIYSIGKSMVRPTCSWKAAGDLVAGLIPALSWLPKYKKSDLKGDLIAGMTVGFILIPQGMAYGLLAGLPAFYGLYASIVPSIIYAFLGTSREIHVGPFALVSLLVGESVLKFVPDPVADPDAAVSAAITLSLYVGLTLLVLAIFRIGFMVSFLADPVLSGFTTAAAILIGTSQVKHLFGLDVPRGSFIETYVSLFSQIEHSSLVALGIGVGGLLLLHSLKVANRKWIPNIPVPNELMVLILATLAVWAFNLDKVGNVKTLGYVPAGIPAPILPDLRFDFSTMVQEAFVLALIIYIISSSVGKTFATNNHYQINPNQELVALGFANLVGSFFLCYPACGSLSRSAIVDSLDNNTPIHSLFSAIVVIITLLFLTPLLPQLPNAVLAAIIFYSLRTLISQFSEPVRLWKISKADFLMWIVTFLATLFLGTTFGIICGSLFSLAILVKRLARPGYSIMGKLSDTSIYRRVKRYPDAGQFSGVIIFRFEASIIFVNKDYFRDKLKKEINRMQLKRPSKNGHAVVVLDCSSINVLDVSALDMLHRLAEDLDVDVYMAHCRYTVRVLLEKSGFNHLVPRVHMYVNVHDAVKAAIEAVGAPAARRNSLEASAQLDSKGQADESEFLAAKILDIPEGLQAPQFAHESDSDAGSDHDETHDVDVTIHVN